VKGAEISNKRIKKLVCPQCFYVGCPNIESK
jgi:hypothetical protein